MTRIIIIIIIISDETVWKFESRFGFRILSTEKDFDSFLKTD